MNEITTNAKRNLPTEVCEFVDALSNVDSSAGGVDRRRTEMLATELIE